MNIKELQADTRPFVKLKDVCPDILPTSAKTLRQQIMMQPHTVRFPTVIIGKRVYIPRLQFLRFLQDNAGEDTYFSGKEGKRV